MKTSKSTTTSIVCWLLFALIASTLPSTTEAWDFISLLFDVIRLGPGCHGMPDGTASNGLYYKDICHECSKPIGHDVCMCVTMCNEFDEHCDRARRCNTNQQSSISVESDNYNSEVAAQESNTADEYTGQSSGGVGVVSDMAQKFELWMAAVVVAVVMALVAIVLGQRKENRKKNRHNSQNRAVLSGAVGRRLNAVSAFADGVLPARNRTNNVNAAGEQVEMSGYKLDYDEAATASFGSGGSRGSRGSHISTDEEENMSLGGYESAYA